MAYRWVHRTWKLFWTILGVLILVCVVLSTLGFAILQLPASKSYIASKIEDNFNNQYKGVLKLGEFSGAIPFDFEFKNVAIYQDSTSFRPVFSTDTVNASVDFWALFRNQLIINHLDIKDPVVLFRDREGRSLAYAIEPCENDTFDSTNNEAQGINFEVLVPSATISGGVVIFDNPQESAQEGLDTLTIRDINAQIFIENKRESRFFDIDRFSFNMPELDIENANIFGQVFNDEQYLEFNAFNIRLGSSALEFSSEFNGVDFLKDDFLGQIQSSEISYRISELLVNPGLITRFYPEYERFDKVLYANFKGNGSLDSLWFEEFDFFMGRSGIDGYGFVKSPLNLESLQFEVDLENVLVDSSEFSEFVPQLSEPQIDVITTSSFDVKISGNRSGLAGEVEVLSSVGEVITNFDLGMTEYASIDLNGSFTDINLGGLISDQIIESHLTGSFAINSDDWRSVRNASGSSSFFFSDGNLNRVNFDTLSAEGTWNEGIIRPSLMFTSPSAYLTGRGTIDMTDSIPGLEFTGSGENVDLKGLTQAQSLDSVFANLEYEIFLKGNSWDNVYGQLTIDVPFATIGEDTLPTHQVYMDLNEPGNATRALRFTSTAFDMSMQGSFQLNELVRMAPYWSSYFKERVDEEVLLTTVDTFDSDSLVISSDQNFTMNASIKNLDFIKAYVPAFPSIQSAAQIRSNVNGNPNRLLFNASINDPSISFKETTIDSLALQVTGSFRSSETLKSFSGLQAQLDLGSISTGLLDAKGLSFEFDMQEDSIIYTHTIDEIAEDSKFELTSGIALTDSAITAYIHEFALGSDLYLWEGVETPSVQYLADEKLRFQDFELSNFDENIAIEGILSADATDSVNYQIENVDLERISDLINGRINFSGDLNGQFTTRSLTRSPTLQGELNILGLGLDNNVVGDISVLSEFNQPLNRFDTEIIVDTDSTKYPDYYFRNNRTGQDISLKGYILAPDNNGFPETDSLFRFDLDFENVDLWIIPFIAPKVFSEMSGKANGSGLVWGNLEDYDFNINYDIGMDDAVYMRPRFLDTFYYGIGSLSFSRDQGLNFEDVFVIDPSGGAAIVSGTYNLNDFSKLHSMDLLIEMDEFQFLNSILDQDVPFFGDAYGSSTIRLTGTNLDPVLETVTPVYISDFSNIGIPLLEETEFDEDNKFIRFVDDFSSLGRIDNTTTSGAQAFLAQEDEDPFERTFTERFTMDLQFIALQPMTVRLIFDPVTGDAITADGTGRLQIRLQDEELSMFGQFDISGGNYQFVSGDIFARRFELERGGTITWNGNPTDASLNLNAFYEARPDINTLTQSRSDIDQDNSQRVPVQLVLNVGGTLSSIENNFFFRLPNTFEARQNTALSAQINTLNRNEDEKLIQATSFLLMGDFIPSTTATTSTTDSFSENFSGSGAVLNPLLSSQVISPLLSNQINSLLRSDVGSLDIDFNLNTYNNVDLAVALRLYNDRIILSREGQITGAQSNIGDIGATYRINQTLSVTAFHRQDPTFSNLGSGDENQQGQDINGLGLEAEVNFNSWDEFLKKITRPFRKLFGRKNSNDEQEDQITENQTSSVPGN
ncbi:MAG: hypothetical protein ED557_02140 [Balneola sp.]|nr:MAG: hypothetical protein ED557_02140 [Balneola sp.]